jgi:hypothetical protein
MKLYHVGRAGQTLGAVIEPSRYVDRLAVDDEQALREDVLEAVRADDFPDLPPRNEVVFTWTDIRDAGRYLEGGIELGKHAGDELIYVVAPAPNAQIFRGDYGWLAHTATSLEELDDRAFRYWSGAQRPKQSAWETLVRGCVRIEEVVTGNLLSEPDAADRPSFEGGAAPRQIPGRPDRS